MTNNVDPLAARAAEVEAQGKAIGGEDTWAKGIMPTLERKISSGELSQVELAQKLARPNAASEIFNSNIADADEATCTYSVCPSSGAFTGIFTGFWALVPCGTLAEPTRRPPEWKRGRPENSTSSSVTSSAVPMMSPERQ